MAYEKAVEMMGKKYVDRELTTLIEKWKEGQNEILRRKKNAKTPPEDEDVPECECWWDGEAWNELSYMEETVRDKKPIYSNLIPRAPEKILGEKAYKNSLRKNT